MCGWMPLPMRRRPREKNFLNDPETWELLQKIHALAEPWGLTLLPEIYQVNATYYSAFATLHIYESIYCHAGGREHEAILSVEDWKTA